MPRVKARPRTKDRAIYLGKYWTGYRYYTVKGKPTVHLIDRTGQDVARLDYTFPGPNLMIQQAVKNRTAVELYTELVDAGMPEFATVTQADTHRAELFRQVRRELSE